MQDTAASYGREESIISIAVTKQAFFFSIGTCLSPVFMACAAEQSRPFEREKIETLIC